MSATATATELYEPQHPPGLVPSLPIQPSRETIKPLPPAYVASSTFPFNISQTETPSQEDGLEMRRMGVTHRDERSATSGRTSVVDSAASGDPFAHTFEMSQKDEKMALAVLSYCLFLAGWNDATLGPLLLRIQEHYHLTFTIVSLLFISGCTGFITGAILNVYLSDRFGFGKIVVGGAALQVAAYSILAGAPPFPAMCFAYVINGIGIAMQNAQANAFVASIPRNQSRNMGILHAAYGTGAFAAPLIATQFAQLPRWSFHFIVSLGLAFANMVCLAWAFKLERQEHFIPETNTQRTELSQGSTFKHIFGQKFIHAMAIFVLVYVGVEVTIGGWIVTYLIGERGAGPSAGYVSSGFFAGLGLGRILLIWVNRKIGERRVIYLYSAFAVVLELTIWLVPSLIENAVAVSLVGLALGPLYPIAMNIAGGILPRRMLAGAIGWIAGSGQAGSAIFPFLTGAMAQKYGVKVLQPLVVAMMLFMAMLWFMVTKTPYHRRAD